MSTERYEIKGKIGEGGVGSVYHAYDTHLNRDVAIKRVLADGGYEDQEEATKSLLKEATALSSVQHPHIVTVYDAGVDDDGPYVVMELIHGRTLDEMVERATMTWEDLREVALQSQEALIAAQDLDLVHRDLKPSNLMVCWLPSGKFQVKIVDFGLAKFSAAPSLQTIAHGDAVFGSIFFMAPEQFERIPLDKCTDMYSMGCLYYYSLTGEYPFNGETAAMVMASHLQHHVTPLHELRPDIPRWGCDWIMWHLEREMKDRPQDARESLGRFILLDQQATQPVTVTADNAMGTPVGAPADASATPGATAGAPKLIFPSSATGAVGTQPAQINPLTAATATQGVSAQPTTAPQFTTGPQLTQYATGPQQVQTGTAPQFATGPQLTQYTTGPQQVQAGTAPQSGIAAQPGQPGTVAPTEEGDPIAPTEKSGLPPVAKWTIIGLLALVILVAAWVIIDGAGDRQEAKDYKSVVEKATQLDKSGQLDDGLTLSKGELTALLNVASSMDDNKKRVFVRKCLAFARGEDFDADPVIITHLTTVPMTDSIRSDLFKYVITKRANPSNITPLLEFAKETNQPNAATQALRAAEASLKGVQAEDYFDEFLDLINNTESDSLRAATESAVATLLSKVSDKEKFASTIQGFYESAVDDSARFTMLRLLASTGGNNAEKTISKALNSDNRDMQNAAIAALGHWTDDSQFETLTDFIAETDNSGLRKKAFDSAYGFLRLDRDRNPDDLGDLWGALAQTAKSQRAKLQIISGMANQKHKWAVVILDRYIQDSDDKVIDKAEQAKEKVERKMGN